MSRTVPLAPCLVLLKQFEPNRISPATAIQDAATAVMALVGAGPMADLNDGQFAALIDFYIWVGVAPFQSSKILTWVQGGNLTLPPATLFGLGARGRAEADIWNAGSL